MAFKVLISALATGVGNIQSVVRALDYAVASPKEIAVTSDADAVRRTDVLVVPGQGSFGAFASGIGRGLREAVLEHIERGKPYLGICLGLQILFEESDEAPGVRGLGVLPGRVRRLEPGTSDDGVPLALPHIGWNVAQPVSGRDADVA